VYEQRAANSVWLAACSFPLLLPIRYKNIRIPGASVIAVAAENDFLPVGTEHGKGIKAVVMADLFHLLFVPAQYIHIKWESSFVRMVAAKHDPPVRQKIGRPVGLTQ
jgi:hypothetical protein